MSKRITILGGGESGYGVAVLAKKKGYNVFLSDSGVLGERYRDGLISEGVSFEEGKHSIERLIKADIAVKSPGIPDTADVVVALRGNGIPIVSEMEFAAAYLCSKIISITGSNGKTTTATLTHKLLKDGGVNVALAGNIGDSFAFSVANEVPDWYVLELSSFQLDGCFDFRSDIAVLTNITPDHLDRYNYDLELYTASKFRVAMNQTKDDIFIVNGDDAISTRFLSSHDMGGRVIAINNRVGINKDGAFFCEESEELICRYNGEEIRIDINRLKIKGLHNYANIMDSVLVAMAVGVDGYSICESLYSFGGVEHRLEFVDCIGGVEYINDSKATNVDSAWYALESMTRPTVWIAGGTDKGNDYEPLKELAKRSVKALVCMGRDNSKLLDAFEGVVEMIYDTHSIDEAFSVIGDIAKCGDTVLLSPASASFDLFENYEDRGRQFKQKVKGLKNG